VAAGSLHKRVVASGVALPVHDHPVAPVTHDSVVSWAQLAAVVVPFTQQYWVAPLAAVPVLHVKSEYSAEGESVLVHENP
jgi:hypothetical protein